MFHGNFHFSLACEAFVRDSSRIFGLFRWLQSLPPITIRNKLSWNAKHFSAGHQCNCGKLLIRTSHFSLSIDSSVSSTLSIAKFSLCSESFNENPSTELTLWNMWQNQFKQYENDDVDFVSCMRACYCPLYIVEIVSYLPTILLLNQLQFQFDANVLSGKKWTIFP